MPSRPALHCSMEQRLTTLMVERGVALHTQSDDGGILWPGSFRALNGFSLPTGGVGSSSLALAGTASGRILFVAAHRAVSSSGRMYVLRSENYGQSWGTWRQLTPRGILGSPHLAAEGNRVHVAARDLDRHCLLVTSTNRGQQWGLVRRVGEGVFATGPAVATGDGGETVILVARGLDHRFWMARSRTAGQSFELAWAPIGPGTFLSAPGAALSADLSLLVVAGLGMDHRIWWNRSQDLGTTWAGWRCQNPSGGTFLTGPSVATDWNGERVWMTAVFADRRVVVAGSTDRGHSWSFGFHLVNGHPFQEP